MRPHLAGLDVPSTLWSAADEDFVFGLQGGKFYARKQPGKRSVGAGIRESMESKESLGWHENLERVWQAQQWGLGRFVEDNDTP